VDKNYPQNFGFFKSIFLICVEKRHVEDNGQKNATRKYRVDTFSLKSDRKVKTSSEKNLLVAVTKFSIRKYLAML